MSAQDEAERIVKELGCGENGCPCIATQRRGSGVTHCPSHDDHSPSFSVTIKHDKLLVNDLSGACDQQHVISALRERGLWHVGASPSVNGVTPLHESLTVRDLAKAKGFTEAELASFGVTNGRYRGQPAVRIAYSSGNGEQAATRYRLALHGPNNFAWTKGSRTMPYGLDRLEGFRRQHGWVLFVEGESDAWTGWHHDQPVVGIPGKKNWKREHAAAFAGFEEVYVWQEPEAEDFPERIAADLPNIRVIAHPPDRKDLSEAHLAGDDVPKLLERLRAKAVPFASTRSAAADREAVELQRQATAFLDGRDPLEVVADAIRNMGYGGALDVPMTVYVAATSRVLGMRPGTMPVHLLLLAASSGGKSYALGIVLRLLPDEAYHAIDASSPRVLIYDPADLRHRALIFSEADSLPGGAGAKLDASEDNPAASAVRNLLQDHRLHYAVTVRDPETGAFTVSTIDKPGPTVLLTTATRRLGAQMDTRVFSKEVPDDAHQIGAALDAQVALEEHGAQEPPAGLIAYQAYLQRKAPWQVRVPFAAALAGFLKRHAVANPRVMRDYQRLLSMIKAVTVLRHAARAIAPDGMLVADVDDYAAVRDLVADMYELAATGGSAKVREAVAAVGALRETGASPVTVTQVAAHLGVNKMAASRRVNVALKAEWLRNRSDRRNEFDLALGEPLPPTSALPTTDELRRGMPCNSVTPFTERKVPPSPDVGAHAEPDGTRLTLHRGSPPASAAAAADGAAPNGERRGSTDGTDHTAAISISVGSGSSGSGGSSYGVTQGAAGADREEVLI